MSSTTTTPSASRTPSPAPVMGDYACASCRHCQRRQQRMSASSSARSSIDLSARSSGASTPTGKATKSSQRSFWSVLNERVYAPDQILPTVPATHKESRRSSEQEPDVFQHLSAKLDRAYEGRPSVTVEAPERAVVHRPSGQDIWATLSRKCHA